jgi:hypothetical protein
MPLLLSQISHPCRSESLTLQSTPLISRLAPYSATPPTSSPMLRSVASSNPSSFAWSSSRRGSDGALEVASEDDSVLVLGEKWCAILFDLSTGSCSIWGWSDMSKDDILMVQVSSASSSFNHTICSMNILFLFSFLCLLHFFLP